MFEHPFKLKWGEVRDTSNLSPKMCNQVAEPGTSVSNNKLVAEPGYHNHDPLIHLLGCANEAVVMVEGGGVNGTGRYSVPNCCPH